MEATDQAEFSHESNIAIALREFGQGCEEVAAALDRREHVTEATIAEMEQAAQEIIGNLRTLAKASR